jgi:hypothetical protein
MVGIAIGRDALATWRAAVPLDKGMTHLRHVLSDRASILGGRTIPATLFLSA